MIREKSHKNFAKEFREKISDHYPASAQIELTHRCNLNCIHCYCKDSVCGNELTPAEWKGILDQLISAGTLSLTMTGGEPLVREDFFEIYEYAKIKGLLITVFTNGTLLDDDSVKYLMRFPPYSIEVTLNGITKDTYDSISQVEGSFDKAMSAINKLASAGLPLSLKAIGLKQNKKEILKIKAFAKKLLGKDKFKFDSFITPRLSGDRTPCRYRLSPEEICDIEEADPEMRHQRIEGLKKHRSMLRAREFKYNCNAWRNQFYITPYGQLRFCYLSDKYSTDLKTSGFIDGFYKRFPDVLKEKYNSCSECIDCDLREFCYHCPARAYLETGNEEAKVQYFCDMAKMKKERTLKAKDKI